MNEHRIEEITFFDDKVVFGDIPSHPLFKNIFGGAHTYTLSILDNQKSMKYGYSIWRKATVVVPSILIRCINLSHAFIKLLLNSKKNGAKLKNVVSFVSDKNRGGLKLQLSFPIHKEMYLIPTLPYMMGQVPWLIEIEDVTTLFTPFINNGETYFKKYLDCIFYPIIKALLEDKNCKGILCHTKSAAESIPLLFDSEKLKEKVYHIPLGIDFVDSKVLSQKEDKESDIINILFTNSWHQQGDSFYLRGGIDLLEAFSILCEKYQNIRLTLRSSIPKDLDSKYRDMIISDSRIKTISFFVSDEEMNEIMANSDIFVLPSARLHVVSILKAMAYSIPVVTSDGWGISEYVEDSFNGFMVKGRYESCSWVDKDTGALVEDYRSLYKPNPTVINGIVEYISRLIENKDLRIAIGLNARKSVESKFSVEQWNTNFEAVLDDIARKEYKQRKKYKCLKWFDEKLETISNSANSKMSYVMKNCKNVVIYGACTLGEQYMSELKDLGINVVCFIDNYYRQDVLNGIPVYRPQVLLSQENVDIDAIVLASVSRADEMKKQLKSMGVNIPIHANL